MQARAHAERLAQATGPTVLLLPEGGCNEWDRPGADLHDAEGLAAFLQEMRATCPDTCTDVCSDTRADTCSRRFHMNPRYLCSKGYRGFITESANALRLLINM